MFDSNKTWFCKQLRTEDAKQITLALMLKQNGTEAQNLPVI